MALGANARNIMMLVMKTRAVANCRRSRYLARCGTPGNAPHRQSSHRRLAIRPCHLPPGRLRSGSSRPLRLLAGLLAEQRRGPPVKAIRYE